VLPHAHADGPVHATFSCGIASSADFCSVSALIGAADTALLAAKRQGRNRVLHAARGERLRSVARVQVEESAGGDL
jgi:PleD family two-component response regulator